MKPVPAVIPPASPAPAPQRKEAPTAATPPNRRRLVSWLWRFLGLAALGELGWITASFLQPRRSSKEGPNEIIMVAGPVGTFAPNSVTAFPAGKFYLVRLADGGFLALHRECTHLGCTVPWDPASRRFICPCHSSSFDATGQALAPPAPRPLDLLPLRIENDIVKVDVSRRIRRDAHDLSQVVRS